jgi:hypothetical protein
VQGQWHQTSNAAASHILRIIHANRTQQVNFFLLSATISKESVGKQTLCLSGSTACGLSSLMLMAWQDSRVSALRHYSHCCNTIAFVFSISEDN